MLLNFLLVIILLIGNQVVIGQCPEKNIPRTCECKRIIKLCQTNKPLNEIEFPLPMQANDKRDCCDFECSKKCDEAIRNQLYESSESITESNSTDKAINKLCEEVFPNSSENRGGFCLSSETNLTGCPNDFVNIMEGL